MNKVQKSFTLAAATMVLGVAGCGGGGGGDSSAAAAGANTGTGANTASAPTGPMFDFLKSLVASSSETAEPVDISGLTISTSETAPPDGGG